MKTTLKYGVILGFAFLLVLFGTQIADIQSRWLGSVLNILLMALVMFFGLKELRDHELEGYISYKKGLWNGFLMGFFGVLIFGIVFYVYFGLINASEFNAMMTEQLDAARESMADRGMSEEQIEDALSRGSSFRTPLASAIMAVISTTVLGLLIALLMAVFVKKEKTEDELLMERLEQEGEL